jgi:hypothetical protein
MDGRRWIARRRAGEGEGEGIVGSVSVQWLLMAAGKSRERALLSHIVRNDGLPDVPPANNKARDHMLSLVRIYSCAGEFGQAVPGDGVR